MSGREKTVITLVVVAVFFGGYLLGTQRSRNTSKTSRQAVHHHNHRTIEVAGDAAIPRVDLVIHKDARSGRNLEIVTENFRFSPEHGAGEGHAHLYIDGKKIARENRKIMKPPE